mmetsp:Transcript_80846/g.148194  ORF Transcript_80846/g.148194 Transcript_80846/m.148194 type:complete len:111 (+) Transcript_80846:893-1225(+)
MLCQHWLGLHQDVSLAGLVVNCMLNPMTSKTWLALSKAVSGGCTYAIFPLLALPLLTINFSIFRTGVRWAHLVQVVSSYQGSCVTVQIICMKAELCQHVFSECCMQTKAL